MPIRPEGLKLYTNSRGSCARRCMYRHHLMYDLGWREVDESEPLIFGGVMHEGLEVWLVEHIGDPAVRDDHWRRIWARRGVAVEGEGRAEWAPDPLGCALDVIDAARVDPYLRARARASMRAYHERWAPTMAEDYRVVAVELEFTVPLTNPDSGQASRTWALGGKIDAIVEIRAAMVLAPMEHKTTSKDLTTGGRYWKRLRLDPQLSQYIRGARRLSMDRMDWGDIPTGGAALASIDRAVYDVIQRPGLRPGKATPLEERKHTQPKMRACPECKKKSSGLPPPHKIKVPAETEVGDIKVELECEPDPTGEARRVIVTDRGGRLYAGQRERDETPEEYEARVYAEIKGNEGRYFVRETITRTDDEIRAHEADTWAQARLMHAGADGKLAPRNVDGCDNDKGPCAFLDVCFFGPHILNDTARFRRVDNVHEELSELVEPPQAAATTQEDTDAHA